MRTGLYDIDATALYVFHEIQLFISCYVIATPNCTAWRHIDGHDDLIQGIIIAVDLNVFF